jgi:two-component system LytT family response regulator
MKLLKVGIRREGKNQLELKQDVLDLPCLLSGIRFEEISAEDQSRELLSLPSDCLLAGFYHTHQQVAEILSQLTAAEFELLYISYNAATDVQPVLEQLEETDNFSAESKARFMHSFETAAQRMSHLQGDLLESLLKSSVPQNRKINLPTLNGFRRFDISTIIRCESADNYTTVYFTDHKKILVCRSLQEFEVKLSGYGFFRVHHKHLINTEHIVEYQKGKGGQIILSDNSSIDVSVRKKSEFIRYINDFS